eukprot:TRINITY_DN1436_c1_g1_i1.p2 TRINITY_DN1436_c1_g1~~TRINITY_DN1436_c1_g1_i1.p2  ORF type:complete len:58 (-),score=2.15 TRINITY_DN1436_c1_g1_i1:83-256(-)
MSQLHIVFIVDRSGGMSSKNNKPELVRIQNIDRLNNRLGCVYNSCDSFIEKTQNEGV